MSLAPIDSAGQSATDEFAMLFAGEIDEVQALAREHGVRLDDVAACYFALVDAPESMLSHDELQARIGLSASACWDTASVLVEFGEIHRAKEDQWWWVHAPAYLAALCRERELSLKRYIEMEETLRECQDAMINWYETRQMHGNLQRKTMGEIKLDYCQRLQRGYWGIGEGEELVGEETWSDHRVSRYVRTAQDVIVEAYNLTY